MAEEIYDEMCLDRIKSFGFNYGIRSIQHIPEICDMTPDKVFFHCRCYRHSYIQSITPDHIEKFQKTKQARLERQQFPRNLVQFSREELEEEFRIYEAKVLLFEICEAMKNPAMLSELHSFIEKASKLQKFLDLKGRSRSDFM